MADILDRQVILGLYSLGSKTDRLTCTQALFLWLFYHRLTEGKTAAFKYALIVEEAHNLFQKKRMGSSSSTTI